MTMAYDMIEDVQLDMNQYNDFLRLMDDYKAQLYMDYINKEKINSWLKSDYLCLVVLKCLYFLNETIKNPDLPKYNIKS